jgi:hypothetical protein
MKKITAIFVLAAVLSLNTLSAGVPETIDSLTDFRKGLNDVSESFVNIIPNVVTQQSVWGQSWIGTLPHFGLGLSTGAAFTGTKVFTDALGNYSAASDLTDKLKNISAPIATYSIDGRIGGFILPFDIGVNVWLFPKIAIDLGALTGSDGDMSYASDSYSFGFDFRYAILKDEGILPGVSVGVGYNFYYTSFEATVNNISANAKLTSNTIVLSAQLSKKLLSVLVPYVGIKGIINGAKADWDLTVDGSGVTVADIPPGSFDGLKYKISGGADKALFSAFNFQLLGGLDLQFRPLVLHLGVSLDVAPTPVFGLNGAIRLLF